MELDGFVQLSTKEVGTICRIRVGADEIILWLRKNGRVKDVTNPVLGGRINDLICNKLGGELIERDVPSYWPGRPGDHNIGEYKLPLNSAQYKIEIDRMSKLYETINEW